MNGPSQPPVRVKRRRVTLAVGLGCLVAGGSFVLFREQRTAPIAAGAADRALAASDGPPEPLAGAPRAGAPASVAPGDAPGMEAHAPADRLSDEAIRALATEVENGRIEGVVMSGTRIHGGGQARLWPDYMSRAFGDGGGKEPLASVQIAPDGTFRIEGVAPGAYGVEIGAEGATTRLVSFAMPAQPGTTQRIVVALESGGVAGRVFDRVGKPAVGVEVHVNPVGSSRGLPMNCECRVGANGSYEVGGLAPGPYWIVTHLGADWWTARDDRTLTFEARAGEVLRLDLGSARGEPLWTGVLRTTGGKPVRGRGELVLGSQPGSYDTTPFDVNGAFSKRLAAGAYRVEAHLPTFPGDDGSRRVRVPIEVVIADRDLAQDLVLPGARVSGIVKDRSSGTALVGTRGQSASLTPEGKDHHSRRSVALDADGSFVIDGVGAGRYVVSGWPAELRDASRGTITIEVREGVPEVALEAWIGAD